MKANPTDHGTGLDSGDAELVNDQAALLKDQAALLKDQAALLRDLAALPQSIQPGADPWQKIASRIALAQAGKNAGGQAAREKQENTRGRVWMALAASVLLVVVSSLFMLSNNDIQSPDGQAIAIDKSPVLNELGAQIPTTSVEREYQAAFREFAGLGAVDVSSSNLPGEAVRQSWDLMQQLETELLTAMAQEPENPLLKQRLKQLRAHQLNLLHIIADSGMAPRRNLI